MKNCIAYLLVLSVFAVLGLASLPVVSFAEDRVTPENVVVNPSIEKPSAAAGLFDLKTETDRPVVMSSEKPISVYRTVADIRAQKYSDALRQERERRLLRNLASEEKRYHAYIHGGLSPNDRIDDLRAILTRYLIRAGSGSRE